MGSKTQNQWCRRMRGIGIPVDLGYSILDLTERWKVSNGLEWTVNRIKAIKNDLVRFHAGQPPVGTWYAKTKSGRPKGPFGRLWKQPLAKAVAALNVYTTMVAEQATPAQWAKFYGSVTAKPVKVQLSDFEAGIRLMPKRASSRPYVYEGLEAFPVDPSRRAPIDFTGRTGPETDWMRSLWDVTRSPAYCKAYATFDCVARTVDNSTHQLDFESWPAAHGADKFFLFDRTVVGKIGFTQEPGCKLRAFASPVRFHQAVLEPLKRDLFGYLKRLPQDCTFDQGAGVVRTQDALRRGVTCYSIDLSDATNNFPLSLIASALKRLGFPEDDLAYMYAVSRGLWRVNPDLLSKEIQDRPKVISWTKGIPLGLGPAFAAFAITNHLVVRQCEAEVGVRDMYSILGDDIVIYHPEVAARYRDKLANLGCPVSESKTLVSDRLAEFAGKLISSERSIPSPKWRQMSDDNFIEVVKLLGPQAVSLLRPRQRRVFNMVAPLPEPWGLGWNPKGLSLTSRWEIIDALASSDETLLRFRNTSMAAERNFARLSYDESFSGWDRYTFAASFADPRDPDSLARRTRRPTRATHRPLPTTKERVLAATGVFAEMATVDTSFSGFTPVSKPTTFRRSALQVLEGKLNKLTKPDVPEV